MYLEYFDKFRGQEPYLHIDEKEWSYIKQTFEKDDVKESSSNENLDNSAELSSQIEVDEDNHEKPSTENTPPTVEDAELVETLEPKNEESTEPTKKDTNETTEASQDFEILATQLAEVGMDKENIESLLTAVKSGKAPIETVQATIEKLRTESESESE